MAQHKTDMQHAARHDADRVEEARRKGLADSNVTAPATPEDHAAEQVPEPPGLTDRYITRPSPPPTEGAQR